MAKVREHQYEIVFYPKKGGIGISRYLAGSKVKEQWVRAGSAEEAKRKAAERWRREWGVPVSLRAIMRKCTAKRT